MAVPDQELFLTFLISQGSRYSFYLATHRVCLSFLLNFGPHHQLSRSFNFWKKLPPPCPCPYQLTLLWEKKVRFRNFSHIRKDYFRGKQSFVREPHISQWVIFSFVDTYPWDFSVQFSRYCSTIACIWQDRGLIYF